MKQVTSPRFLIVTSMLCCSSSSMFSHVLTMLCKQLTRHLPGSFHLGFTEGPEVRRLDGGLSYPDDPIEGQPGRREIQAGASLVHYPWVVPGLHLLRKAEGFHFCHWRMRPDELWTDCVHIKRTPDFFGLLTNLFAQRDSREGGRHLAKKCYPAWNGGCCNLLKVWSGPYRHGVIRPCLLHVFALTQIPGSKRRDHDSWWHALDEAFFLIAIPGCLFLAPKTNCLLRPLHIIDSDTTPS